MCFPRHRAIRSPYTSIAVNPSEVQGATRLSAVDCRRTIKLVHRKGFSPWLAQTANKVAIASRIFLQDF